MWQLILIKKNLFKLIFKVKKIVYNSKKKRFIEIDKIESIILSRFILSTI